MGFRAHRHLSTAKRVIPSDKWPKQTCAAVGREETARMQPRTTESVGRKRTVGHDCKKIGPNNRSLSQEQTGATMLALRAGGHASEKKRILNRPYVGARNIRHPGNDADVPVLGSQHMHEGNRTACIQAAQAQMSHTPTEG